MRGKEFTQDTRVAIQPYHEDVASAWAIESKYV
jgi:hypothetical protein